MEDQRKTDKIQIETRNRLYIAITVLVITNAFSFYETTIKMGPRLESIEKEISRITFRVDKNSEDIRQMEKYLPSMQQSLVYIQDSVGELKVQTKELAANQNQILPVVKKAHQYIIDHWEK